MSPGGRWWLGGKGAEPQRYQLSAPPNPQDTAASDPGEDSQNQPDSGVMGSRQPDRPGGGMEQGHPQGPGLEERGGIPRGELSKSLCHHRGERGRWARAGDAHGQGRTVNLCAPSKQSVFWSSWRTEKGKAPRCTSHPPQHLPPEDSRAQHLHFIHISLSERSVHTPASGLRLPGKDPLCFRKRLQSQHEGLWPQRKS